MRLARILLALALAGAVLAGCATAPPAGGKLDATPRIAVVSAFQPELTLLLGRLQQSAKHSVNGVDFTTGVLEGKPVVLFLSGISMTNAAMNTQLALDRFQVSHLVVSGIAGGVNPGLHIGDVTVAQRWGQYLEVLAAREVAPGQYKAPGWMNDVKLPNFGMLHPRPVQVRSAGRAGIEEKFWFEADPALLAVAGRIAATPLGRCDAAQNCLSQAPKVVVGGNGVSGPAFVDNAAFREYSFKTFQANVLDMETAAMAHVAYSNGVPYIAFRSLSDLAGGGEGENEIGTFFKIAADNSARVLLAFLTALK
ncbi:5'-methylthioadenosine/S-adenosylhomocysteine nucleosidase [uncultured Ramlibacter sp.]|uniref:5'-methylthioadenosine/S-adenosylhomocysteine nucleosidase n=1 Tax=uncultured Ramlibacter sp. TaxID=260755 RepID=UPI002632F68F|nr:5'-methylthioadenosine/S-adenosylhomocysteine nucleosidase [uncultured Ramlibacter sp.]